MKLFSNNSAAAVLGLIAATAHSRVVYKTNSIVVWTTIGIAGHSTATSQPIASASQASTFQTVLTSNEAQITSASESQVSPISSTSTSSSSSSAPSFPSAGLDVFQQTILDDHNNDRNEDSASPLSWDSSSLQSQAQSYANKLCSIGYLVHSGTQGMGENLYWISSTDISEADLSSNATEAWYSEKSDYTEGVYSHYTQLVWRSTTKLGCAYSKCDNGKGTYVVCEYNPQGNIIGEEKENIN